MINTKNIRRDEEYYIEFTYKHNNSSSLTFKFRILLVNFDSSEIDSLKTKYKLKYNTKEKKLNST